MHDLRELEQTSLDQHADAVRGEGHEYFRRALFVREPWAVALALKMRLSHFHRAGWGCGSGCTQIDQGLEGIKGSRGNRTMVYFDQPNRTSRRRGRADYLAKRRLAKVK